jgi:hypothetical protein
MIKGFDVVFLVDAEELLNKLDDRAKRKIIGNIFKSRYMMNADLFKKLHHDIWEFRTIHLRRHFRFLAFWDKRQHPVKVVVTVVLQSFVDTKVKYLIYTLTLHRVFFL